jgi:hypothetical protein
MQRNPFNAGVTKEFSRGMLTKRVDTRLYSVDDLDNVRGPARLKMIRDDRYEHTVRTEDIAYERSTSIVHSYFPPFDSDKISKLVADRDNMEQEEVLEQWRESATKGTTVHALIEDHIRYGKTPVPSHPHAKEFYNGYMRFRQDNTHLVNWHAEIRVYWARGRFRGTIDALAFDTTKKEWIVVDWKRVKAIYTTSFELDVKGYGPMSKYPDCNHIHYSLQTGLYAYVISKFYSEIFGVIKSRYLVQILRDGTGYNVYPCHSMREEIAQVAAHRISDELETMPPFLALLQQKMAYVVWRAPQENVYVGRDAQRRCIVVTTADTIEVNYNDTTTSLMFEKKDRQMVVQKIERWFDRRCY